MAFPTFGEVAAAVTVAVPGATPVTCTIAVVAFCAIWTDAGTVTTPVGLAVRFTVMPPAGAAVGSVSVKSFVSRPVIERLGGAKLNVVFPVTG